MHNTRRNNSLSNTLKTANSIYYHTDNGANLCGVNGSANKESVNKESVNKSINIKALAIVFLVFFFMAGCTTTYAPVEHRKGASYQVKKKYLGKTVPAYYRVKKGDTLYSIAWVYGLDYKKIAYRNKIKAPYRIFIGQRLSLSSKTNRTTTKAKTYKVAKHTTSKTKSRVNSKVKTKVKTKTKKKKTSYTKSKHKTSNSTKGVAKKKTTKVVKKGTSFSGKGRLSWQWPLKGRVIQRYSPSKGKKGIDISAAKGTIIKSAEAGKVVYSGQGLVGYGRLIIIKHNESFLSAYAHNKSLLVDEGQLVKKGQAIARLGRSGTDRYKLHFEIRKNGKPINPMNYLPH